ncbi:polysaccharide deacetylase family protein [Catellatospora sp. KI3]|uniref:polysaccharide deacetylase family protein n=1 Tax=Catellatospora sp. KI3 TaxID=3041620 RepID=UPI002482BFCE|nr:polysaccharide deacetylase family protein [Catellatospora sp. KI3]MDI1462355.1 polysaccharide deacetylase family protein [Catellatospora sp. KI3]
MSRRGLMRGGLAGLGGAAAGIAVLRGREWIGPDRLPLDGGYAPAGNELGGQGRGAVSVLWHVRTEQPLVALTFDDGPAPDWTPRVLDTLDRLDVAATFFVVGQRLRRHAALVRDRYARHEVGNHTWAHKDLAQRDERGVRDQLRRCHDAVADVLGREPTLLRPPWGHLGGTTLTVAEELGYDVVMWSRQMREAAFARDPAGIVADTVAAARPGAIILAHDVGDRRRLVTIDHLTGIVAGLRDRGLRPVTVSALRAAAAADPAP